MENNPPPDLATLFKAAPPRLSAKILLLPRAFGHVLIRAYQLSLSMFFGRTCRFLPSCSNYMDEAILRHGLYKGGFMGFARLCRCNPRFEGGIDNVPVCLPVEASTLKPWRYGKWK